MNDTADQNSQWFERSPERLEWEIKCFDDVGLGVSNSELVDDASGSHWAITTLLKLSGDDVEVNVKFPFNYPDAPPTFLAPTGLLSRHQNPHDGNLCIFEDRNKDWWPDMSAAEIIANDVQSLFADSDAGLLDDDERDADMPEPVSAWLERPENGAVALPDYCFSGELTASSGHLKIGGTVPTRFVLSAEPLGRTDPALLRRAGFQPGAVEKGWWYDVEDGTIVLASGQELFDLIDRIDDGSRGVWEVLKARLKRRKQLQSASCPLAFTFIEEGPRRKQKRRAWAIAEATLTRSGQCSIDPNKFTKTQAFCAQERLLRIPELAGLANATALVVGVGSLGGQIAAELSKAGVGVIDLVDSDVYDVNNAVRHVLPVGFAGSSKADGVALLCTQLNPFVTVTPHQLSVGTADASAVLDECISRASIVVDTTGEITVARTLYRHCAAHSITMISVGLTSGSFGGDIAVMRPDGICPDCVALGQRDGIVPSPLEAPASGVTPRGCSHPAFSGAGFEATELASMTARAAIQACGHAPKYPKIHWDWMVVNFRGDDERYRTGSLEKREVCVCHET